MTRRTSPAAALTTSLAAASLVAAALAGCGLVPPPSAAAEPTTAATAATTTSAEATPAPAEALRTAARASVRLRSIGCTGVETGSGFAVDPHVLVTNAHVVVGAQQLQVDTWDGHELQVTGTVVEAGADLAVVRTREELPTSLRLADADPAAGEAVTVVGYPRGEALARAAGTVVGPVTDPLGTSAGPVLAVDAQVAPGSSGSAVVDAAGAVVGVVYAGAVTGEHAYAVPVSVLRTALSGAPSPSDPSGGC